MTGDITKQPHGDPYITGQSDVDGSLRPYDWAQGRMNESIVWSSVFSTLWSRFQRQPQIMKLRIVAAGLTGAVVLGAALHTAEALDFLKAEEVEETACVTPTTGTKVSIPENATHDLRHSLENIQTMRLTCEGLINTLSNINTQYYALAQQNPKFNPTEMEHRGIPQGPTEFYTKHITAEYYNANGPITRKPLGGPNIPLFIDAIDRNDKLCCGVNQFIDRNGTIYWLAPGSAKLRHNPGYDGQTAGHEMEGYTQPDLTVAQLEASAYLDLGNLIREGLYGRPLAEVIRGHAHSRAEYNNSNSPKKWPAKQDWEEVPTAAYRQKLQEFINSNPDLHLFIPDSFLALP